MRVYATVKQAGLRRGKLEKRELILSDGPFTLETLITEIVGICVADFNIRRGDPALLHVLTAEEIECQTVLGKVGFGAVASNNSVDFEKALANALLSFEDGLYRVFVGDEECTRLDQNLDLREGSVLTFIRFTMLAGRMW